MHKPKAFEKPMGFRDYPPRLARQKRAIEQRIQSCFARWGYREIVTPTLEFYDTVGHASAISEQKMFKCMDRAGNTLVLRPDQTAPIARVVSSILHEEPLPLRLCYHANVFRAQENEAGRNAEFYQSGVELIGLSNAWADAEVIALSIEALQACGVPRFRLSIGHVGFVKAWMEERLDDPQIVSRLKRYCEQRNRVGFQQLVEELSIPSSVKQELLALLHSHALPFDYFYQKTTSDVVKKSLNHLYEVWDYLKDWKCDSYITFDPTLTGSLHYYTGVVFEGYAETSGFPLLSGGRYDQLLGRFGRSLPATGFALEMDRLMEATPQTDEPAQIIHIYFPVRSREEAFQKAKRLRAEGKTVILHMDESDEVVIRKEEAEVDA